MVPELVDLPREKMANVNRSANRKRDAVEGGEIIAPLIVTLPDEGSH
jgi:hypothetical protein